METGALGHEPEFVVSRDILYADDTLLVSTNAEALQKHFDCIVEAGRAYGLELNLGETVLLRERHDGNIVDASGSYVKCVDRAVYLGGLLSADGMPHSELSRRLGEAGRLFDQLSSVWKYANMPRWKKNEFTKLA